MPPHCAGKTVGHTKGQLEPVNGSATGIRARAGGWDDDVIGAIELQAVGSPGVGRPRWLLRGFYAMQTYSP